MATNNSQVKFTYIQTGSALPTSPDSNTVYFLEGTKQLYVGSHLIADHLDVDLSALEVKSVSIAGTGNTVSDATFDRSTGALVITKGNLPTLAKGTDTTGTAQTLAAGGTFTVVTDTAVSDHTITDQNTTFTLPHQISNVEVIDGTSEGQIKVRVSSTDSTSTTSNDITVFDPDDYMASAGGTATDATITLHANPTTDLGAATKQYVDSAVAGLSGAMHYIGISTTAITDGGTEDPTIGGDVISTQDAGDVVIYDGLEFVWNGSAWEQFGDESSFALKTRTVNVGAGLSGGGALTADVTISHASAGATVTTKGGTPDSATEIYAISDVKYDQFGHVTDATEKNLYTAVKTVADASAATGASAAISNLDVAAASGDYVASISETDGLINATMGTKGTVTSGDTSLVDGGTVYNAVNTAKTEAITAAETLWTVI